MAHGAVHQLATLRGVTDIVLLTRDHQQTQAHFGSSITTARTLEFPWAPQDRQRYLREIKDVLRGDPGVLPPEDQVFGVIETIRSVDALLIAGGGNMNSTYGWLLYERAAIAHIARALGKQVVISGQTLGPALSTPDRAVLRELLADAELVGLREEASFALAQELCPRHSGLRRSLDDATVLPPPASPVHPEPGFIAATFSGETGGHPADQTAIAYARLLDQVASATGHRVVFLPHMAHPGADDGDEAIHAVVASHMSAAHDLLPIASALETAALTAAADLVVTSRYHPTVFACGAGRPTLGIAPNAYTDLRIGGALLTWGIRRTTLPLADVISGVMVDALLASFKDDSAHLSETLAATFARHARWWDSVVDTLESRRGLLRYALRHWLRRQRASLGRLRRR